MGCCLGQASGREDGLRECHQTEARGATVRGLREEGSAGERGVCGDSAPRRCPQALPWPWQERGIAWVRAPPLSERRSQVEAQGGGGAGVLKTKAQSGRRLLASAQVKEQKTLLTRGGLRTKTAAGRESNSWDVRCERTGEDAEGPGLSHVAWGERT